MRITICAVGRMKSGAERDLIDRYSKRIQWPVDIVEVEERHHRRPHEAQLVVAQVQAKQVLAVEVDDVRSDGGSRPR